MILGLDISSSKIGIAIVDDDKRIIHLNLIKYKKAPLEDKAVMFSDELSVLKREYNIEHIFIEEPVSIYAAGRTTAHVISTLQRFNGMCSLACRNVFASPYPAEPKAKRSRRLLSRKCQKDIKRCSPWSTQDTAIISLEPTIRLMRWSSRWQGTR